MAIIGSPDVVAQQVGEHAGLALGVDFVARCLQVGSPEREILLGLALGEELRLPLGPGVVAMISHNATRPRERGKWETHVRNIDVQAVIEGEEFLELADRQELSLKEDLSVERDAIFYHPHPEPLQMRLRSGVAVVLFSEDAHCSSLAVDASLAPVRKIVVKVER